MPLYIFFQHFVFGLKDGQRSHPLPLNWLPTLAKCNITKSVCMHVHRFCDNTFVKFVYMHACMHILRYYVTLFAFTNLGHFVRNNNYNIVLSVHGDLRKFVKRYPYSILAVIIEIQNR